MFAFCNMDLVLLQALPQASTVYDVFPPSKLHAPHKPTKEMDGQLKNSGLLVVTVNLK